MPNRKSSGAVIIRAVVMLVFLIAIPLVALSGSSLPEMIRKAKEKFWPLFAGNQATVTSNVPGVAPRLGETKPDGEEQKNHSAVGKGNPQRTKPGPFVAENRTILLPTSPRPAALPQEVTSTPVVSADYQATAETTSPPLDFSVAENEGLFLQIQKRLRELGATYYLLETWGNEQRLYRFYCQMSVAGSGNYTRCFEATHSNPLEAMQVVLQQVENWRAKRK